MTVGEFKEIINSNPSFDKWNIAYEDVINRTIPFIGEVNDIRLNETNKTVYITSRKPESNTEEGL